MGGRGPAISLASLVVLFSFLIISDGRRPQVCRPRYLWASWEEIISTIRFLNLQAASGLRVVAWSHWTGLDWTVAAQSSIYFSYWSMLGQFIWSRLRCWSQTKLSAATKQKIIFSSRELRMLLFTQQDSFLCSSLKCKEKIQRSCQD